MSKGALEISENAPTLRAGALVDNRYRVLCTLGLPSECAVTYLATDEAEQRPVVLKELFPRRFVARTLNGTSLRPHTSSDAAEFSRMLRRFVRDGELLAEITHQNLARTLRCVEANDTAYWVIEHCAGVSLFEYTALASERTSTLPALDIGMAILSALEAMHAESLVYRDVSPQRVLMRNDGRPLLLSPSSERYLAGTSKGPTAGFAPLELYGSKEVGPWTDVYGCAGLLYFLLTGVAPPSAIERASTSTDLPALGPEKGVDPLLGAAIVRGLSLAPERRPHSIREFRRLLESGRPATPVSRDASAATSAFKMEAPRDRRTDAVDGEASQLPQLRLEGGIVLPGQDESVSNVVRRFALGLIRGTSANEPRDEDTSDHNVASPEITRPAQRAPVQEQPLAAPQVAAPPRQPAPAQRSEPVVEDEGMTAALGALSKREPRERINAGLSPQALATLVGERERTHSRAPLVAAAVIVLFLATAGVVYATRGAGSADVPPPSAGEVSTTQALDAASGGALTLTPPTQDSSTVAHVTPKSPSVPQTESAVSSRRAAERVGERVAARTGDEQRAATTATPANVPATAPAAATPTDRPATPSRLANVPIAIPTVGADLRSLPSGLVVAIQTRAANGKESAEQGAYVSAREAFRGALKQLDSVAAAYPRSLQLESLRRDITQMDEQTAQACRAENDVRQKRGGKPILCS